MPRKAGPIRLAFDNLWKRQIIVRNVNNALLERVQRLLQLNAVKYRAGAGDACKGEKDG